MESREFIDQLLAEAEESEQEMTLAHYDMLIVDIIQQQRQINEIKEQAKREVELISEWRDKLLDKYLNRIDYLEAKLHSFIAESNVKTIDMPHGVLKIRKKPDKVTVEDMDTFIANAKAEMLKVVPETYKPDLNGIKNFIKRSGQIPQGVKFIEGTDSFSLSLKTLEV